MAMTQTEHQLLDALIAARPWIEEQASGDAYQHGSRRAQTVLEQIDAAIAAAGTPAERFRKSSHSFKQRLDDVRHLTTMVFWVIVLALVIAYVAVTLSRR